LETRVKKKFRNLKNGEIEKSVEEKHTTDHKPALLKQASNKQELTDWENILITNHKDLVITF
jgi:hypothetical protein